MATPDRDVTIALPGLYLDELIERVDDVAELKLALRIAGLAAEAGGLVVPVDRVRDPAIARAILGGGSPRPTEERLMVALARAVADGVVVRVTVREPRGPVTWVGPATPAAREFVDRLRAGAPDAEAAIGMSPDAGLAVDRPNVFALYEHLIGPLTPLVADELRDAERMYPSQWIEDAMASAVDYNRRNWRYVRAILRGWEEAGAPNAAPRRDT